MFAPFNQLVSELEFRIFHSIFCEVYRIQRKAFAFDEYVSLVYEKFALTIIEIGVVNWAAFVLLMLINLGHTSEDSHVIECDGSESAAVHATAGDDHTDDHATDDGHASGHTYSRCADNRGIVTFTLFGCALCLLFMFMAVLSRHYELQVMRARGIKSIEDYPMFVQVKPALLSFLMGSPHSMCAVCFVPIFVSLIRKLSLYLENGRGV